jgi:WD40 repeat protein
MRNFLVRFAPLIAILVSVAQGQIVSTDSSKTNQSKADYETWIAPYREHAAGNRMYASTSTDKSPTKLIITVVDETPRTANADNASFVFDSGRVLSGITVSLDGEVSSFFEYSMGSHGGCCAHIAKEELERTDQLLANLPADNSILPPYGRRVVIQVAQASGYDARVYDLANAPDEILELFRLTRSGIGSTVLRLGPETEWTAPDNFGIAGFAVTSDGQTTISSGTGGPIKIWQTNTQTLLRDVALPQNVFIKELTISPDDSMLVGTDWGIIIIYDTKTWQVRKLIEEPYIDNKTTGFYKPHFIQNGKYLILETDKGGLRIYETKTWKRLLRLPEIPNGAIAYYPSLTNDHSVYAAQDGEIKLRNNRHGRDLTVLGKSKLENVSYSPDESKVAVVTSRDNGTRNTIQIWNAENGEFIKELRPFEQTLCESVDGVVWSPDGKFFMAMTKASLASNRGIDIWDVESGRHRAELTGCVSDSSSPPLVLRKNKIMDACANSNLIGVWDLTKSISEINEFEGQIVGR